MAKFLDQAGLQIVWNAIKEKFIDNQELEQFLAQYEKIEDLQRDYADRTELAEILSGYATEEELERAVSQLAADFVKGDIETEAGKARIFNEADGGGAKFEAKDGTASFAGVNSDTNGGIGAQLYDIDVESNTGSKLDVTREGIFYTTGYNSSKPAAERDVSDNELVTRKDLSEIEVPEYSLRKENEPGDYAAIYHLTKDGVDIGTAINIPKDQLLKSVEVKVCTEKDVPVEGLVPGDKYLDFTFIVEKGAEAHTYIAIKDMAKPYTAGEGIIITSENEIQVDQEVIASVEYVDANITDTMNFIIQERDAEHAGRVAGDELLQGKIEAEETRAKAEESKKVDKQVSGSNGEAYIFNEADGGGAKFVHTDGSEAFVGVNDGGEEGLMAQIYADKFINGKWQGAKIDVTNGAMYYTVGNKSFAERAVAGNEIATKADVEAAEPDALTEEEIREICK